MWYLLDINCRSHSVTKHYLQKRLICNSVLHNSSRYMVQYANQILYFAH